MTSINSEPRYNNDSDDDGENSSLSDFSIVSSGDCSSDFSDLADSIMSPENSPRPHDQSDLDVNTGNISTPSDEDDVSDINASLYSLDISIFSDIDDVDIFQGNGDGVVPFNHNESDPKHSGSKVEELNPPFPFVLPRHEVLDRDLEQPGLEQPSAFRKRKFWPDVESGRESEDVSTGPSRSVHDHKRVKIERTGVPDDDPDRLKRSKMLQVQRVLSLRDRIRQHKYVKDLRRGGTGPT